VLTEFQEYMLAPWRAWSVCLLVGFGKKVEILFYFYFYFLFLFLFETIIVILFKNWLLFFVIY
jgi:hypothetical protein